MEKQIKKKSPQNKLVIPAIIFVAIVTQVPFLVTIILSLFRWIVIRPDRPITFVGFKNYTKIFTTSAFYTVILNTVIITLVSLALCTLLGIIISLLLDKKILGVNIVRTLIIAPFFVMDAVAGIIWKTLLLHPSFGWNGYIAQLLHLDPVDFLGEHSLETVIMLVVWRWTPFFVLIILGGLQGISNDILESAEIDGANWFQTIISIKLPAIVNHIEVAIMLGLVFIIKIFGIIYVTTFGGPGESSTNLPFYVYKVGFFAWDVGKATAVATVMVILTLIIIVRLFNFMNRRFLAMR